MCSYKKLAILALAASSVSPALSAATNSTDGKNAYDDILAGLGAAGLVSGVAGAAYRYSKTHPKLERAAEAPEIQACAEFEGRTLGTE